MGSEGGTGEVISEEFDLIIEQYSGRIYGTLYRMLGNAQDTEDLVQEVFLRAYKSLPGFEGKSSIARWLYRIAMNTLADFLRAKKRSPEIDNVVNFEHKELTGELPCGCGSAEDTYLGMVTMKDMRELILALPIKYRAPFVLNIVEGYTHKEIAKIMGISPGNARIRLYRAIKILQSRTIIEDTEPTCHEREEIY